VLLSLKGPSLGPEDPWTCSLRGTPVSRASSYVLSAPRAREGEGSSASLACACWREWRGSDWGHEHSPIPAAPPCQRPPPCSLSPSTQGWFRCARVPQAEEFPRSALLSSAALQRPSVFSEETHECVRFGESPSATYALPDMREQGAGSCDSAFRRLRQKISFDGWKETTVLMYCIHVL